MQWRGVDLVQLALEASDAEAEAREIERMASKLPSLAERVALRDRCRELRGLLPAFYPDIEKYETFDGVPI